MCLAPQRRNHFMLELYLENPGDFEDPLQHAIGFYRAKLLQSTTLFPPSVCARKDVSSVAGSTCVCATKTFVA